MIQQPHDNYFAIFEQAMAKTGSDKTHSELFHSSSKEQQTKIFFDAEKGACRWFGGPPTILRKISIQLYKSYHINLSELHYLCSFMFLQNDKKHFNYADAQVIQTFQYMFHLRQEITEEAIDIIIKMGDVKTLHLKEKNPIASFLFGNTNKTKFFIPPLELAFNWMKRKQPQNYLDHLEKMFNGCSDIENVEIFKDLNFKFIAFNQISTMMKIYEDISQKKGAYDSEKLNNYLNKNKRIFSVENENEIFDRFLPEIKVLYLKAQSQTTQFSKTAIEYMLTLLKNVEQLTEADFKILFHTSHDGKFVTLNDKYQPKYRKFQDIENKLMEILAKKAQFLGVQFLMDVGSQINFQSCLTEDTILSYYILTLLSEVSYQGQVFPKNILQKLSDLMVKIPHDRIQKIICYILLCQKKNIGNIKNDKATQQLQQTVNFTKMNELLKQGKLMALNLLQKAKFPQMKSKYLEQVLNDIIRKETDIEIVSKIIIAYWKLQKQKQNLQQIYEELLIKNTENEEAFLKILKIRTMGKQEIPPLIIEGVIKFIEENRGCKDSALQILVNLFSHQKQKIKSQIIMRTFDIFVNDQLFDVNTLAFKAMIKSIQNDSFVEVVEKVLQQCQKSLKQNAKMIKRIKRQSQKQNKKLVPQKGLYGQLITVSQRICYLVFIISKSLSKNKRQIKQKKHDIQSHFCNIYKITKDSTLPNNARNDIINSFNYLLMSQIDIPDDILESLNQAMINGQEYSPYFKSTPIYNLVSKKFSQVQSDSRVYPNL